MDGPGDDQDPSSEFSRPPTLNDLISICNWLNAREARYVVIGGMAMNYHGMLRGTHDIDLLVDPSPDNMIAVLDALSHLPDGAAKELRAEEIQDYSVLRINDEVTVDLLGQACGVTCEEALSDVARDTSTGTTIPYASALTLLRSKETLRDKDRVDRLFLVDLLEK